MTELPVPPAQTQLASTPARSQETGPRGRKALQSRASYRVAVVPGDGIGPEVTAEATKVLQTAASADGFALNLTQFSLGAERYLAGGSLLSDEDLGSLSSHDAILFGAVGDPRVEPGVLEVGLLLRLRKELDLYVNLRPAKLLDGVPSPLDGRLPADLDLVIVRENTEGAYSNQGQVVRVGSPAETATEMSVNTASAVERIVRFAFDLARQKNKRLTLVHKTNVMLRAGGLYRRIFNEIATEYPEVETSYQHADAAALLLVTDPSRFSVIVTDNLFGDVLSDLAAGLVGGIGFVASGNVHPGRVSLFEPVHGSAPDLVGSGKANPIGAILSGAMLLSHIGETKAAERVERAVETAAHKVASGDLSTSEVGDLVAEAVA